MPNRIYHVCILASRIGGTLYVGVTSNHAGRVFQHREKITRGFTANYGVARLVYFETFDDARSAIAREKHLKHWNRAWKIRLIEEKSPNWDDLYDAIAGA